ncbi:DegT/DnrJ/EryC1/StrS family aminotransferase [Streptomyces sp. M10(2022)]
MPVRAVMPARALSGAPPLVRARRQGPDVTRQRRRHPLRRTGRGPAPVQAPLCATDGSIDPAAVPDSVWAGLCAVLTTNLYGNPDPAGLLRKHCDRLGIPLIEDAAHAIGSETAGTPSAASVTRPSSASPNTSAPRPAASSPSPTRSCAPAGAGTRRAPGPGQIPGRTRLRHKAVRRSGRTRAAPCPGRPVRPAAPRAPGARGDPDAAALTELASALTTTPSLGPFHSWVRVDMHDYRTAPGRLRLRRIERLLARLDGRLAAHRSGTRRLLATRWAAPGSADTRRNRCSACHCWSRTGTRRSPPSPATGSRSATSTIRRWTPTRASRSPNRPRPRQRRLVRPARPARRPAPRRTDHRHPHRRRHRAGERAAAVSRTRTDGPSSGGTRPLVDAAPAAQAAVPSSSEQQDGANGASMFRNAYALMLSTGVSAALGLGFWLVAARYYSEESVGQGSAAIAAMRLLASITATTMIGAVVRCAAGRTRHRVPRRPRLPHQLRRRHPGLRGLPAHTRPVG